MSRSGRIPSCDLPPGFRRHALRRDVESYFVTSAAIAIPPIVSRSTCERKHHPSKYPDVQGPRRSVGRCCRLSQSRTEVRVGIWKAVRSVGAGRLERPFGRYMMCRYVGSAEELTARAMQACRIRTWVMEELMGMLVNGEWQDAGYETSLTGGHFERRPTTFRNWVTADGSPGPTGSGDFVAERGRYHCMSAWRVPGRTVP